MRVQIFSPDELDEDQMAELVAAYAGLIEAVGWPPRRSIGAALARSLLVAVADDGHQAVGAARVVGDGIYAAVLYDLVVDPRCQARGLGQALVDACLERTRTQRLECIAGPEAIGFYTSIGWERVPGFARERV